MRRRPLLLARRSCPTPPRSRAGAPRRDRPASGAVRSGRSRMRQRRGDAVVLLDEAPARHLGRVRGEHQLDLQRADGLVQAVGRDAAGEQPRERRPRTSRAAARRAGRAGRRGAGARDDAARRCWPGGGSARRRGRSAARRRRPSATARRRARGSRRRCRRARSWPARARARPWRRSPRPPAARTVSPSSSPSSRTSSRSGLCGSAPIDPTIPAIGALSAGAAPHRFVATAGQPT